MPRRFEYVVLDVSVGSFFTATRLDGDKLATRLNELGSDGWELVSASALEALQGQSRDLVLILKRELG